MLLLAQQIYTVVSDGLGFFLKRSPPIINRVQLTPSDTCTSLPDTAWLFSLQSGRTERDIQGNLNVAVKEHFYTAVMYHPDAHLRDKMSPWKFPPQRKALVQPCDKSHLVIFRCSTQSFWGVGAWGLSKLCQKQRLWTTSSSRVYSRWIFIEYSGPFVILFHSQICFGKIISKTLSYQLHDHYAGGQKVNLSVLCKNTAQ